MQCLYNQTASVQPSAQTRKMNKREEGGDIRFTVNVTGVKLR